MKLWAIKWEIASYDGPRVLSIWTSKEAALEECYSLAEDHYGESVFVVEFEANTRDGLEDNDTPLEEST